MQRWPHPALAAPRVLRVRSKARGEQGLGIVESRGIQVMKIIIYNYLPGVLLTGFVFCFFPQALHPRSSRNKAGAFVFFGIPHEHIKADKSMKQ